MTEPTPDWLLSGREACIVRAADRLRSLGHVVLLAGPEMPRDGLPPPNPDERAEAPRHAPEGFLHRRQLARAIAASFLETSPAAIAIGTTSDGAPFFSGLDLTLSFSTRAGFNLIGIARQPIGVDIELPIAPTQIPWNILRPDERSLLEIAEADQALSFIRLWNGKEAVAKAMRLGFILPPESLRHGKDGEWFFLDPAASPGGVPVPVTLRQTTRVLAPGVQACLAIALLSGPRPSAMTRQFF
jgi:phosphopantetheinyl transferase